MTNEPESLSDEITRTIKSHQANTRKNISPRPYLCWFLAKITWGSLLGVGLVLLVVQVHVVSEGQTDFCQDYIAAHRLLQGLPVYQPLNCYSNYFSIPTTVEYDSHPPFTVLLFLPFSLLSQVLAYNLWGFCCLGAYLASGYLLLREMGWLSLRAIALFVISSFCWPLFREAELFQNLGQVTTLLLVIAWLLERRGYDRLAGGFLGLATLIKIWPAVFLVFALTRKRWRETLAGGLCILLGTALTFIILSPGAYFIYLGPIRANETLWVTWSSNSSLLGIITRALSGLREEPFGILPPLIGPFSLAHSVLLAEIIAGLFLGGSFAFITYSCYIMGGETADLLSYGLLITVLLLSYPLSWFEEMLPLLLTCTTLILALRKLDGPPHWWFILLGISAIPLLADPSWLDALAMWMKEHGPALNRLADLAFAFPTFGLILFAGLQAYLLWRAHKLVGARGVFPFSAPHQTGDPHVT